eukprot:TRINITY_DN164968_c0_g1_i2.p1 TRINITY_DN164968_c0_g1~~TRINITY_DN164968_c0_g1_i2.p1  ORF type:complete len:163 (+),score=23.02 TRINITY_DN164968_c0_g1_i2:37-525(+)
MLVRDADISDFEQITKIYNYYIKETVITFEEELVNSKDMIERFEKIIKTNLPWIVVEENGDILGYAYAHFWHERSAYRFTVEPSIYLNQNHLGKGLGKILYEELINRLKKLGIKNVLSLITVPNDASLALHRKFGFEVVGRLPDIGFKFEKWQSTEFWQLRL